MEETLVPITDIKTDERLQPRNLNLVPWKKQDSVKRESDKHTQTLRELLESSKQKQLTPIDIVELNGKLTVVDGHHRLRAYKKANRKEIPIRKLEIDFKQAYIRARTANAEGRSLSMHAEQCSEAAWQILLDHTKGGTRKLPKGMSVALIAARTGASNSTVGRMYKRAMKEHSTWRELYTGVLCDPVTSYPFWKHARGTSWQDGKFKVSEDKKWDINVAQAAKTIGRLLERFDTETVIAALRELAEQERIERDGIPLEFIEPEEFLEPDKFLEKYPPKEADSSQEF